MWSDQRDGLLAAVLGCKEATLRQRLREWYRDAEDKKGAQRQTLDVASCFGPLLTWVLSAWPPHEKRLALAIDATSLGQLFTVLAISVVYRLRDPDCLGRPPALPGCLENPLVDPV